MTNDTVRVESGLLAGARSADGTVCSFKGVPYARAAGRAAALEATATAAALERHPARDGVRAAQHPAQPADACGGLLRPGTGERGLPHPEHLDCRPRTRRKASGDGLVSRRRLPGRLGVAADLSRRRAGAAGRRAGHRELSARAAGFPRASRTERGAELSRLRQLWASRPARSAALDQGQHRRVRRRSGSCHNLRPIGRLIDRQHADGFAAGQGPLPARHRAKWRLVLRARPSAARRRGKIRLAVCPRARRPQHRRAARKAGARNPIRAPAGQ